MCAPPLPTRVPYCQAHSSTQVPVSLSPQLFLYCTDADSESYPVCTLLAMAGTSRTRARALAYPSGCAAQDQPGQRSPLRELARPCDQAPKGLIIDLLALPPLALASPSYRHVSYSWYPRTPVSDGGMGGTSAAGNSTTKQQHVIKSSVVFFSSPSSI